jgi:dTMP kinase
MKLSKKASHRGRLIAICGLGGSGKSTQIEAVRAHLSNKGRRPIVLKKHTDWYRSHPVVRLLLGQNAQLDIEFLALLAAANRRHQLSTVIRPALDDGHDVLMDQCALSGFAYFMDRGINDMPWLQAINSRVPFPDLAVCLDVPAELARERVMLRDAASAKDDELDLSRIRRARRNFLALAKHFGIQVVDGTMKRERVTSEVLALVDTCIMPPSDRYFVRAESGGIRAETADGNCSIAALTAPGGGEKRRIRIDGASEF